MDVYIDPRNVYNPPKNHDISDLETMPYETLVAECEKGPVTAEFFRPFIGYRNVILVEAGDLPGDIDKDFAGITPCFIRRVDIKSNKVQIGAMYHTLPNYMTWVAIWYDADELALRIEAT
jgi:hypothetical protein